MKRTAVCFVSALLLTALLSYTTELQASSTIQFTASSYTVAEWAGTVTLTVQRLDDTNAAVSVDYATVGGTATDGLKYTAISGTLVFGAGQTNQTIVVSILNEGLVDGTKAFKVVLSNPTGGAVLGSRTTATVQILDIDAGIQIQFARYSPASGWSLAEDVGTVLIGVVRGDDANYPVMVDFATSDLTATNGVNYIGITNTLSFAPQERLKYVPVTIINNTLKQPSWTFRATLRNPVGISLGATKTTIVTILDNDQGFQFESAKYSVAEDAGVALINVLRGTDATNFTATVDYATTDETATNGSDYTATNGTLSFAPGEKVKVIPIPILNDGINEASKTFRVTLSRPTGGAMLGFPTNATVSILDNDPGVGFEQTASTNAWENADGMTVTVLRGNDSNLGAFTVDYATRDLTAKAAEDYQAVAGTLRFGENETVKTITIPILRARAGRNLRVTLSNPTGGAFLGKMSINISIVGAYSRLSPPFDPMFTIRRQWGVNLLTWTGSGQLQRADRVDGPYETLPSARSPYTVQPPIPTTFYRVTGTRPVNLYVPSTYDGHTLMPLVILLHGYGVTGDDAEGYLKFRPLAEARGFLYCYPTGVRDRLGRPYWNGTDINDLWGDQIDDAGYLRAVIQEIGRRFALDRKRIYLIGHSTGGDMAYTVACRSSDLIAGIASLAGNTFLDPSRCQPSEPVNILCICGTSDEFNSYYGYVWGGGDQYANMPPTPGSLRTAQIWAGYNGASDPVTDTTPSLDLVLDVAGLDTAVTRYSSDPPGGAVELWTINKGTHVPNLSAQFSPRVIDWLLAHPKP